MVGEREDLDSSFSFIHSPKHRFKQEKSAVFLPAYTAYYVLKSSPGIRVANICRISKLKGSSFVLPCFRWLRYDVLSCAALLLFFLSLQVATALSATTPSSTASSKSLTPQLRLGILVAQSCDKTFNSEISSHVSQAIENFTVFVQQTEGNPPLLQVTKTVYTFCTTKEVIPQLNAILGSPDTHAVLSLSTYDVHRSFLPLTEIYEKPYIAVNTYIMTLARNQAASFSPSFSQFGLMLAKLLDMYKWQHVHIIYTSSNFWVDFATYMYFELTLLNFKVKMGNALITPVTPGDAALGMSRVNAAKAVVLLMDVDDQLSVLAAASGLSMTTKHAYFSFATSPYDSSNQNMIGLRPGKAVEPKYLNDTIAKNVNILESLFVISVLFPVEETINTSTTWSSRQRRSLQKHVSNRSNHFTSADGAKGTESRDRHSLNFVSESHSSVNQLISHTDDYFHPAYVNSFRHSDHDTTQADINKTITGLDSGTTATRKLSSKIKTESETLSIPTSLKIDHLSLAQAQRSTKIDSVIKRLSDLNTKALSKHEKMVNLLNTPPEQHRKFQLKSVAASEKNRQTLHFESEDVNFPHRSSTLSDVLQPAFSKPFLNLRRKRDVEEFVSTDADLYAMYDVAFLLSYAVHVSLQRNSSSAFPQNVIECIENLTFSGRFGEFRVDSEQMVSFDFVLYDFNVTSGAMEPRIYFQAVSSEKWKIKEEQRISWPGGVELPPDECFKQGPNCNEGLGGSMIAAIVVTVAVVITAAVTAGVFIRRHWANKEMTKGPNKVILTSEDLVFVLRKDMGKGSRIMKSRATLLEKDNAPDLIRASDPNRSMASINELSDYTETARYNGDLVHVKELDIKGFEMKSKLLTFIRLCRDLRHENLNPYVGFLAESIRPAIVMEYCSRGSLHDIIHNEDFKLDWDFKLSLLTDLVRGIRYLHSSPLKFHGHMTSKNCVIDSRFVLKITDYGVSGIMAKCKAFKIFETKDLLWSAPELLRDEALLQTGSDKGDIYAMSIIFQEVALRTDPYSTTGLSPEEIVKKLKKPPPLIRPSVTPQAAPPQFIQIMKQCWSEMPEMRPGIDDVYDQFKKLTGGKKANIVDTMFKMLEKYSTDLEDIVTERTMQLEEEKKKTDQLLFRMLPSTVAESLKLGKSVQAECFDEVTIYFSDIVGFTTISAMSTPMQVVDLLNDLYSMFDATIDNFDVYKVETIGDAYMVVSGLPIRNGNRHAGEIGTLALLLLSQCGKFTIRHMPQVPLRLRIGLHTGSCVAGVVGTTMPRFCLFGDTVNTASRMESSGAAFRIHISEACKNVLDDLGGYKVEFRGKTELKGKGIHNTYWLVGKEGFDKELPEAPPMIGNNNHGLDSILGELKTEMQAALDTPKNDAISKSNSAPDLATPSKTPRNKSGPTSSKDNRIANSHPGNLDESYTSSSKPMRNANTSVVTADINIVGGGANRESSTNIINGATPEAGNVPCQSRHSESNDSGFGSERKHSQGNDGYNGSGAASTGKQASDQYKRSSQHSSNRTSIASSSDISLHNSILPAVDVGEELATVTEV